MTYKLIKTVEDIKDDDQAAIVQMVSVANPHTVIDFANRSYKDIDHFRFESGYVKLDETTTIEITRVLLSCEDEHDHGVYYQAPRQMELWEAMFAIGEVEPQTEEKK